jgi:hypothetical protein
VQQQDHAASWEEYVLRGLGKFCEKEGTIWQPKINGGIYYDAHFCQISSESIHVAHSLICVISNLIFRVQKSGEDVLQSAWMSFLNQCLYLGMRRGVYIVSILESDTFYLET